MAAKTTFTSEEALALRQRLGMNQTVFWGRVRVGQSAGSRYESGRSVPPPTQLLIAIAYGTEKQRAAALTALTGWKKDKD